jgi:hypothetical protein
MRREPRAATREGRGARSALRVIADDHAPRVDAACADMTNVQRNFREIMSERKDRA